MKLFKVFALFALLHLAGWVAAHWYRSANPDEILIVVDTSIAMKPEFPRMQQWISDFEQSSRYQSIIIGTDKAEIGPLDSIRSKESIFRTVYGRMTADDLKRYDQSDASERILLSGGDIRPSGWTTIEFQSR
ncbi:MAG: hypothetical protein KTR33_10765 [Gammaproteobacteria bacterium]|nr:hypothetical protein [Gammaproteobacteria bacterium]